MRDERLRIYPKFKIFNCTFFIRVTYEYIQVTSGDIWVYTSDMQMTYEYIRVICEWHKDDIRVHMNSLIKNILNEE